MPGRILPSGFFMVISTPNVRLSASTVGATIVMVPLNELAAVGVESHVGGHPLLHF